MKLSFIKWQFFRVFRAPQDIHRVISALFLSVTFSHIYFVWKSSESTEIDGKLLVLAGLVTAVMVFQVLWTFLSSGLNIKLYLRQFVVIGWGVLAHRLGYGVESLGSTLVTVMLFMGWSIWIPFAISGMRFDELQSKIEAWQDAKKDNSITYDYNSPNPDSDSEQPNC
jgi:hypothetical protein